MNGTWRDGAECAVTEASQLLGLRLLLRQLAVNTGLDSPIEFSLLSLKYKEESVLSERKK